MTLKQYLKQDLTKTILDLEETITKTLESLDILKQTNAGRADYIVKLDSLWEKEGEKSTITYHKGRLNKVIEQAEQEFLLTNNRSDVQANYSVYIRLGDKEYLVPEKFYKDFKRKK